MMSVDVLSGQVRNEPLIPVWLAVNYETGLCALYPVTKLFAAEEQSEFERHIEAREQRDCIRFGSRYVVNAVPAFGDCPEDLVVPILCRIADFKCASCCKASVVHCEDQRVKEAFVLAIEWAVYEYAVLVVSKRHGRFAWIV